MSPANTLSGQITAILILPQFVSNPTSNKEYRDSLRAWIQMMSSFPKADLKYKAHVYGAGHLVLMMCNTTLRETLKQCKKNGNLLFKSSDDNSARSAPIKSIISALATEIPAEIVKNKMENFFGVVSCKRQ